MIGSVMLFAALTTMMMLTHRVDWYALFARLRSNGATMKTVQGDGSAT
jgi:inner membrane protein involved in colicin E2 resistance